MANYIWEGNYVIDGREVLLEVTVEAGDASVGMYGIQIVKAGAFDGEGDPIPLTDEQFNSISKDGDLYERIEDQWRAETEAQMETRRSLR